MLNTIPFSLVFPTHCLLCIKIWKSWISAEASLQSLRMCFGTCKIKQSLNPWQSLLYRGILPFIYSSVRQEMKLLLFKHKWAFVTMPPLKIWYEWHSLGCWQGAGEPPDKDWAGINLNRSLSLERLTHLFSLWIADFQIYLATLY